LGLLDGLSLLRRSLREKLRYDAAMHRGLVVAVASSMFACAGPESFWLSRSGATSALVFVFAESGPSLSSYTLDADRALRVEIDRDDVTSIVTLEYERSLAELGIPEGTLNLEPRGGPIPPGDRAHRLVVDDSMDWESIAETPDELADLGIRETRPCPTYVDRPRHLPAEIGEAMLIAPLDADRLLLGTASGSFFEIGVDGNRPLPDLPTTTPRQAGARTGDGDVWLLDQDGTIQRGTLERGFEPAGQLPFGGDWHRLTAAPTGVELWAISDRRAIARSTGGAFELVKPPLAAVPAFETRVGIAWVEPGVAMYIGDGDHVATIIRADGERTEIELEIPPQFTFESPYSIERVAGIGSVVGTRYNVLFAIEGARAVTLPSGGVEPKAEVILDLGDGALLSGGRGELVRYVDGYGMCDPILLQVAGDFRGRGTIGGRPAFFTNASGSVLVNVLEALEPSR
jgi:hypothetical protein